MRGAGRWSEALLLGVALGAIGACGSTPLDADADAGADASADAGGIDGPDVGTAADTQVVGDTASSAGLGDAAVADVGDTAVAGPEVEQASADAADGTGVDAGDDGATEALPPPPECTYEADPGAVTIQRLNRAEYDNTILDLLLDDSAPAREFPPDDHGYGFDHISDVLTVSPLLFEKHERAVSRLVETLLARETKKTTVFEEEAEDLGGTAGAASGLFWNLWSNGTVTATFDVVEAGVYLASSRVSADQAGPELAAFTLAVDGVDVQTFATAASGGSVATYGIAVALAPGAHLVSVSFINDYWEEGVSDRNLKVDSIRLEGPYEPGATTLHVEAEAEPTLLGTAPFGPDAPYQLEVDVPIAGTWRLFVRGATGDATAQAPVDVAVDGEVAGTLTVGTLGGSASEDELALALPEGPVTISLSTAGTPILLDFLRLFGPADIGQPPPSEAFAAVVTCEPTVEGTPCVEAIVTDFARRAWRRQATADEIAGLLGMAQLALDEGDDAMVGLELALRATLLSPHFVFRPQVDLELDAIEPRPLTSYELATRLSFALWSRPPDDELGALADSGLLQDDGLLEEQIRRMIDDPRSGALIDNFAGQWLQLRALDDVFRDAETFPDFDEDLAAAMRLETELVFEELLHGDASFLDLLDADFTYVNADLGEFYGLPTFGGEAFKRVSTVGTKRRGVLTHGSVLTVTSHTFRTSPVKRGKWVLGQLLCQEPPPPPPGVEGLMEEQMDTEEPKSIRELMEQHLTDPTCAACHQAMDPIGFALENFDAIGDWRSEDNGFEIDATGVLPDGSAFDGALELAAVLRDNPATARCIVTRLFIYLVGRAEGQGDRCEVDEITANWAAEGYPLRELIVRLLMSDSFRLRTPPGAVAGTDEEVSP